MNTNPDVVLFGKSTIPERSMKVASEKQVLYVNDSNNGSYNGSITIDSTVLSNSGRYLDWSEASIEVPIVITLTRTAGSRDFSDQPYLVALKAGHFQLIDSIQVDIQNKNVIQSQSYTNFHASYRCLSQWSKDDVNKYGSLTGVIPDSDQHYTFVATQTGVEGSGIISNIAYDDGTTRGFTLASPIEKLNSGLAERVDDIAQGLNSAGLPQSLNKYVNSGKSHFEGTAALAKWYVIATIRLKDVCDLFSKMPLLKGTQVRFTINYNAARVSCAVSAGGVLSTSVTMLNGRTNPLMMTSAEAGQPWNGERAASSSWTLEYNVSSTNSMLKSSRLYIPSYALLPSVEKMYLETFPVKEIIYSDIYQYTVSNVGAGSQFNQLLTNAIVNPQRLVIVPILREVGSDIPFPQHQSPWCGAPFTTLPNASITNLQVLISGRSVFDQPVDYTFQEFMHEVSKTGTQGGMVTGMSSGLISKAGFEGNYSYITIDLTRRDPSEDIVPKSIQLLGKNNTSQIVDYYCFVEYQRSFSVELTTGRVL